MEPRRSLADEIDTSTPNSARVWNYLLGGKDNYPTDRQAGEALCEIYPPMNAAARASRLFQHRAVHYLVGEQRVRQLVDVGAGLPTMDNTHEVAERAADGRQLVVVYVDTDPLVLAHARALLTSTHSETTTHCVEADLRKPESMMSSLAELLDLDKPVGVLMTSVLRHIGSGREDPAPKWRDRLAAHLCPGSFIAVCEVTTANPLLCEAVQAYSESAAEAWHLRTPAQLAACLAGLEMVEPGVVPVEQWRPETELGGGPDQAVWCGVGKVSDS